MQDDEKLCFGNFELDTDRRLLLRGDEEIALQPKTFETLNYLIQNAGRVVTKDELIANIWAGTVVTDGVLTRVISVLRQTLGDSPKESRLIKAVPRVGYRFVAAVETTRCKDAPVTLAIMPFYSIGSDTQDDALEYGMADTLIAHFGALSWLIVRPFSSVRPYHGRDMQIRAALRELKVDYLLEGSLQHNNDRLRVSVALHSAATEKAVWSEHLDEKTVDIFEMQHRICEQIRHNLAPQLAKPSAARRPTRPAAYRAYLEGRLFLGRAVPADVERAAERFEQALDQDPAYAPAWAGVADVHDYFGTIGQDPATHFEAARRAARRTLALDKESPEAKCVLGKVAWQYDWHFDKARQRFEDAIEQHPNHAGLRIAYSDCCGFLGNTLQAIRHAKAALEIDPVSAWVNTLLGQAYYLDLQFDKAHEQIAHTLELAPDFAFAHFYAGMNSFASGNHDEGIASVERAVASGREDFVAALGMLYGLSGRRAEAQGVLDQCIAAGDAVPPLALAVINLSLGNLDDALAGFELSIERRLWHVLMLVSDPLLKQQADGPEFEALIEKIGL